MHIFELMKNTVSTPVLNHYDVSNFQIANTF